MNFIIITKLNNEKKSLPLYFSKCYFRIKYSL